MTGRAVLAAFACVLVAAPSAAAASSASLRITVWQNGKTHVADGWTLRWWQKVRFLFPASTR